MLSARPLQRRVRPAGAAYLGATRHAAKEELRSSRNTRLTELAYNQMISTELNRAISQFRRMYEDNVSRGDFELRMSELPQAAQDNLNKRDLELHPSSMPFCGLRAAYTRLLREPDPVVSQRFGNDYFLNAGHVFHAAIQKWVGRSGQILGDWYCHSCKHVHKFCTTPERCVKCKSIHLEYQELGGKWGKHTHWHTDGLWQAKKLWVIDYKSTSSYAIDNHRKTKTVFPYTSNRFQIETYIPLIEDTYNVKVAGWLLVYAARDNPNQMFKVEVVGGVVDRARREELHEKLQRADKDFGVTLKVKEQPVKVFKRLIPTKLCPDREFYDDFIDDKYNPCPLHKVCFGSKLRPKLKLAIKEAAAMEDE